MRALRAIKADPLWILTLYKKTSLNLTRVPSNLPILSQGMPNVRSSDDAPSN